MRFRRGRPVIVWAEEWFPGETVAGVCEEKDENVRTSARAHTGSPHIHTADGDFYVVPGDWIITEPTGEQHRCTHAVFSSLYEPVNEKGEVIEDAPISRIFTDKIRRRLRTSRATRGGH